MGINITRPVSYHLRISKDLHDWLKANARKNYRTLATEINMHLENVRLNIEHADNKKADCIRQDNQSATTSTQFTQGVNV